MTEETTELRVEQRHRWAADNYLEHFGLNALNRDHMAHAFARFERDITRPAAVDADGVERVHAILCSVPLYGGSRKLWDFIPCADERRKLAAAALRHTAQSRAGEDGLSPTERFLRRKRETGDNRNWRDYP